MQNYCIAKERGNRYSLPSLLINVTDFFRETLIHKYLKRIFFPNFSKEKKKQRETLRIWVSACAPQEKSVFHCNDAGQKFRKTKQLKHPFKFFAIDLSEKAIRRARIRLTPA
jgi:chemotaxis methyl-accepting protein methylase